MDIKAIEVLCRDLQPGDLFSTADQFYWDSRNKEAVGEKVYIRTDYPCPKFQEEQKIFKIEIIRTGKIIAKKEEK